MTCSGAYATVQEFIDFWCQDTVEENEAAIAGILEIMASDIHAALAAQGQCDCTLASWAANYLAKLNIIEAGAFYHCNCNKPRISDSHREALINWVSDQLALIREGKVVVCDGWVGTESPWCGVIQPAVSQWVIADLVLENFYED